MRGAQVRISSCPPDSVNLAVSGVKVIGRNKAKGKGECNILRCGV